MEYGEDFSYQLCPRAKIFRRDQASVTDLPSLKHVMRYNGTQSECLSSLSVYCLYSSLIVCLYLAVFLLLSLFLCMYVR